MANPIFGFPNFVDSTEYPVVLTGGDWVLPLSNLKNPRLSVPARSNGLLTTKTWFDVDLGAIRNVKLSAISSTNCSIDGKTRLLISDKPTFSNDTTVYTGVSAGATFIQFRAPSTPITIHTGDFFTINGYLYKANATVNIAANAFASINLAAVGVNDVHNATVQAAIAGGTKIRCNTGDFTTPVYDSGLQDIFGIIYPFGSLPWEHPSFWSGKISAEERKELNYPVIDILDDVVITAPYYRYYFEDTGNNDTGIALSRLFLTATWQPSLGMNYGATIQYQTDTTSDKSFGGEISYSVKEPYRILSFGLDNLPQNEALVNALDLQRKQNLNKQLFFIFDPDDIPNLQRTSFTCTLQSMNPLTYAYFLHNSFNGILQEIIGGKLT
jgi:hypothetical protein